MRSITKTLLSVENRARRYFQRFPFIQALLAGIGVIIFWRGIWEWLDLSGVTPLLSVIIGALILGSVGVFVQTFIGNTIIIREVKQEEKIEQEAMKKIAGEESRETVTLSSLAAKIDALAEKIGSGQSTESK